MKFNRQHLLGAHLAAAKQQTPFYVYFPEAIAQRIDAVKAACPGFQLRYAVKTNPNPWLLTWLQGKVDSLDISSNGELQRAQQAGWPASALELTGPAKTEDDLRQALAQQVGSIVVEDLDEALTLNTLCAQQGQKKRILVRIAPKRAEDKFGVRLAGRSTQFGVDEDRIDAFIDTVARCQHIEIDGLHIYSGSQCLDDQALVAHFDNMWAIFQRVMTRLSRPVSELVFGAGMGIPYHDDDPALTLGALPACARRIVAEAQAVNPRIQCYLELGRYLVGEAGLFVTQVVRVKESLGQRIAICDGGMNHNLGACGHLGGISHRHYSMQVLGDNASEPGTQRYKVVGPLCTAIDTLAHRINLPSLAPGDYLAVACAGAYGPSASPLYFISHRLPKELIATGEGMDMEIQDISWLGL